MSTDDVGLVEGNPMFYSVSESFKADARVAFVVGNDLTGKETDIPVLQSFRQIPMIKSLQDRNQYLIQRAKGIWESTTNGIIPSARRASMKVL
jgi:hypothetical protein